MKKLQRSKQKAPSRSLLLVSLFFTLEILQLSPFSVPYFPWLFSVPIHRALFPCRTIPCGSVTRRLTMNTMLHCGLAQDVSSSNFKIGINAIVNKVNIKTMLHCWLVIIIWLTFPAERRVPKAQLALPIVLISLVLSLLSSASAWYICHHQHQHLHKLFAHQPPTIIRKEFVPSLRPKK